MQWQSHAKNAQNGYLIFVMRSVDEGTFRRVLYFERSDILFSYIVFRF